MDKNFEKKAIRKMSLVSIIGNTILAIFKFYAGVIGNSGAIISDAVHSFSDVFTTFIAVIGIKIAQKGDDNNHQYGHEKFESLASLILGISLLFTGALIGKSGIENIISGNYNNLEIPSLIALIAAAISIVSKEAMYWYTRYYAKKLNSSVFLADAWHHRSDAFSSVGSLIGVAGAMIGYPIMDNIASVVICLFIIKVAIDITKDAVSKMLDTSCGEEYEGKLREFILENQEVRSIDLLYTRQFGNKVYADLEISVDGNKSLVEAHRIAETIHDKVEQNFLDIKHIMIHVNPLII